MLLVSFTYQQKQAEPQKKHHLPQDSWPGQPLHWLGDIGNASLNKIPGRCRGKGSICKALAPRWESAKVLGGKKSTQFLCHHLPETGRGQRGNSGMSTLTSWPRWKALGAVGRGWVFLGNSLISDDSPYRWELAACSGTWSTGLLEGLCLKRWDTKSLVWHRQGTQMHIGIVCSSLGYITR